MAERVARVVEDFGLHRWAEKWGNLSEELPELISDVGDSIEELSKRGGDISSATERLSFAEYLWHNMSAPYAARWQLKERIEIPTDSVMDNWDEITEMFALGQCLDRGRGGQRSHAHGIGLLQSPERVDGIRLRQGKDVPGESVGQGRGDPRASPSTCHLQPHPDTTPSVSGCKHATRARGI